MCELFGMSRRFPTNVTFSLSVFGERGGHRGPHKDGWGIAFNEGRDFRVIKEAAPASDSACLRFIETHDFRSPIVISHIRRASAPTALLFTNSHPFARELYGFIHVFAHNGEVLGVFQDRRFEPKHYFPLGDTDSERAFCALLDRLREELTPGDGDAFEREASDHGKLGPRGIEFRRLQFPVVGYTLSLCAPLDPSLLRLTRMRFAERVLEKRGANGAID